MDDGDTDCGCGKGDGHKEAVASGGPRVEMRVLEGELEVSEG